VATVAIDANAVGQLITYVAPGFLARLGYRTRYPGPDKPPGEVLIVSVVASLPLVTVVRAALPGTHAPTQPGYIALLLVLGWVLGYGAAYLRGRRQTKELLVKLGYRIQPAGSIYAQTLSEMAAEETVVVVLKDGRRVWGCPRNGPQHKEDGIAELYLAYPRERANNEPDTEWESAGAGVIVPLAEVSTIYLSEEPTGAPPAQGGP
jgi:hypothetical protein